MPDTIEDRIRAMREAGSPRSLPAHNDAMTTWEPTGEVIPISEYNRRQAAFGRSTKEERLNGRPDDEPVDSPHGQVPWWVAQERRQGALTSPVPLSRTLPAPGAELAGQQRAGREQKDRPLPAAPQGVAWKDMANYAVWEPTGEVIPIEEYTRRQVAAGRATKEEWAAGDPDEIEDTPHGRAPKWLRYERSTGAHSTPVRLTDILPAPGAAAAAAQRQAASGRKPKAAANAAPANVAAPQARVEGPPAPAGKATAGRPKARMMGEGALADRGIEPDPDAVAAQAKEMDAAWRAEVAAAHPMHHEFFGVNANAAEPKDQGVLPGEEQVTTRDTFLMLPPDVRMNLRTAHLHSGHADTMPLEDWLSENFGELPPKERIAAMRNLANRKPASMEAPAAAPNPRLAAIEKSLEDRKAQVRQLQAAGPRDLARNNQLQRAIADVEELQRAADAARAPAKPAAAAPAQVQQAAAPPRQVTPEQQARINARRQEQYAREVGNRYSGMMTKDEEEAIDWAATAPGGMEFLRRINADLQRRYQRDRHAQVRDRATNYNLSQDLRNPNYAPGMGVRSLIDAVRSGNSEMAGAVYDIYGNPVAGGQSRALAGVRTRAAADERAAQIEADNAYRTAQVRAGGGDKEDPLKMEMLQRELDTALANPDPVRRHQAVSLVVKMSSGEGADPVAVEAETQRIIASHFAQSGTQEGRDYAMKYLQSLVPNKDQFIAFAVYSLGIDPEVAEMMHQDASKGRDWRGFGRDAGRAVSNAPRAAGEAVGGFTGGFAEGFGGK